jgi:hypothetical protein
MKIPFGKKFVTYRLFNLNRRIYTVLLKIYPVDIVKTIYDMECMM